MLNIPPHLHTETRTSARKQKAKKSAMKKVVSDMVFELESNGHDREEGSDRKGNLVDL
jgi:hypothetical protein